MEEPFYSINNEKEDIILKVCFSHFNLFLRNQGSTGNQTGFINEFVSF